MAHDNNRMEQIHPNGSSSDSSSASACIDSVANHVLPARQADTVETKQNKRKRGKIQWSDSRYVVVGGCVSSHNTHTHMRAQVPTHKCFSFPPSFQTAQAPSSHHNGGIFDDDDGSLSLPAAIRPDTHRVQPHKKRGRRTSAIIAVQQNPIHGGGCRDGSADGRQGTILSA